MTERGAKSKTKGAIEGAKEKLGIGGGDDDDGNEEQQQQPPAVVELARRGSRSGRR